jgi:hypothetical protein
VETEEDKARVLDIRAKQGRANQTKVVIVSDFRQIDPELSIGLYHVSKLNVQRKFRRLPNNPESWNPEYNLIMLLKYWCVSDAVSRFSLEGQVAWVDFGYRPTGYRIDSDSEWNYRFSKGITLFSMAEYSNLIPLFQVVQSMDTYIMGTVVVGDVDLWPKFWGKLRDYAFSFIRLGFMDDDQIFLLMASQNNDWCHCLSCPWGKTFSLYGGSAMQLTPCVDVEKTKFPHLSKIKRTLKICVTSITCGTRVTSYLLKNTKGD